MISKIFHLVDLHIRKANFTKSLFTEYNDVFNNTINDIKKIYVKDESICVICGDIFHHKLHISSHGIILLYNTIHSISDIMPVIIIQGNHDLIQDKYNANNSFIKTLLDSRKHQNIHYYYDKTYSFDFDNIHFGLVSIKDILNIETSYRLVNELPQFPTIHTISNKNLIEIPNRHISY
jgi:DNA repair exonuclease SbcCD nuclease subunit